MRIHSLHKREVGGRVRVEATVVWEEVERAPQTVFYETIEAFGEDLTCDPHAFLVGAILPAIQRGEQRIAIDAPICPELRNGLLTAIAWLQKWSLLEGSIRIETDGEIRYPHPTPARAGVFLSGGVDSLAILRANRLDFPSDHPYAIRDSFFVHGFDIGGLAGYGAEMSSYERALEAVSVVAEDADSTLIPVFTNVRHLYDDVHFWIYVFHGAALASVAHTFSNRLSSVTIASAYKVRNMGRKIIHPLVEPNYSSANLRVAVGGILYSRLERVGLISDWPAALDHLRVCTQNPSGKLNCGECEKCLRTMLQLLAFDSLKKTSVFPSQDVSPAMLDTIELKAKYQDDWYADLVAPLRAQGRHDLAEIVQQKRSEFEKRLSWEEERDWKGAVKRFDRKWLGGGLYRFYSTVRSQLNP